MTTTEKCAIYFLGVPEFEPLVRCLESTAGVSIARCGDYVVAEAAGEIVVKRADASVGHAVWFGALTGGVIGAIAEFSDDTLRVAPFTTA